MQVTDELIRGVVQQVLTPRCGSPGDGAGREQRQRQGRGRSPVASSTTSARPSLAATEDPSSRLRGPRPRTTARKAVARIRQICSEQAEQLGREELEETKIGRLAAKIEKLKVIADRIPGVEFLRTEAFSGENGIALQGVRSLRRHRRHHAGNALAANACLQRH